MHMFVMLFAELHNKANLRVIKDHISTFRALRYPRKASASSRVRNICLIIIPFVERFVPYLGDRCAHRAAPLPQWTSSSFASQIRGIQTSFLSRDAIDVKVPAMGESVTEGTIANVLKKAGGDWKARRLHACVCLPAMRHDWPMTCHVHVCHRLLLFNAGDAVMENDIIAQIETDKVTIDVKYTSKAPGVLSALLVASGDVVQVGRGSVEVTVFRNAFR